MIAFHQFHRHCLILHSLKNIVGTDRVADGAAGAFAGIQTDGSVSLSVHDIGKRQRAGGAVANAVSALLAPFDMLNHAPFQFLLFIHAIHLHLYEICLSCSGRPDKRLPGMWKLY